MAALTAASSKSLGKRPVKASTPSLDALSTTSDASALTTVAPRNGLPGPPQKRVLPSRSRRGGPGIGSCDVDISIMEALKRQGENDPLIPSTSMLLLTTDSSLVPSSSSPVFDLELNPLANERYFDRPEVIKSYKEQQDIQTPEFTLLSEVASVGGRLRARGEEQSADTSDAAYEKRHRKYETFERRQRFREKEKLKHEHYKLKERIEQLRVMDYTAFLVLPASTFPFASESDTTVGHEPGVGVSSGTNINGAAGLNEGERRREKMLEVAFALEKRYRILLPDRKHVEKSGGRTSEKSHSGSVEPDTQADTVIEDEDSEGEEPEEEGGTPFVQTLTSSRGRKIRLKINLPPSRSSLRTLATAFVTASSEPQLGKQNLTPLLTTTPLSRRSDDRTEATTVKESPPRYQPTYFPNPSFLPYPASISEPRKPISFSFAAVKEPETTATLALDGHFAATESPIVPVATKTIATDTLPSASPPRKKSRMAKTTAVTPNSTAEPHLSDHTREADGTHAEDYSSPSHSISANLHNEHSRKKPPAAILLAASRNPDARKTSRTILAFGVKPAAGLETYKEFQIPEWLLSGNDSDGGPSVSSGPTSPAPIIRETSVTAAKEGAWPTYNDESPFERKEKEVIYVPVPQTNGCSPGDYPANEAIPSEIYRTVMS